MKTQNKPSLSDIARQNNTAKVSKFANSIIPTAPEQNTPPVKVAPDPVEALPQAELPAVEETESSAVSLNPSPAPAPQVKPARKRSGTLSMDDIIGPKAPEEETFAKMTRIAEKHHDLLREIAFKHRKPMNTVLYNLLEALEQTYQREQQNHA